MKRFWDLYGGVFRSPDEPGGAGGDGGAGDPAGTPPGAPGGDPWYKGVDESHTSWLASKQFATMNDAIQSHRTLEGTIGRQRLAVPKDATDQAAYDEIYKTLGRPGDAKGYKLSEGVKFDDKVWDKFSGVFHKAGLSQAQAEMITKEFHGFSTESVAAKAAAREAESTAQKEALTKEWGNKAEANTDLASRAYRALGITDELADKVEDAIGYAGMMKLFHQIGSGMGEASLAPQNGGNQNSAGSYENAVAARDRLLGDAAFQKRYTSSNQLERNAAIAEIQPHIKVIADFKDAKKQGQG